MYKNGSITAYIANRLQKRKANQILTPIEVEITHHADGNAVTIEGVFRLDDKELYIETELSKLGFDQQTYIGGEVVYDETLNGLLADFFEEANKEIGVEDYTYAKYDGNNWIDIETEEDEV